MDQLSYIISWMHWSYLWTSLEVRESVSLVAHDYLIWTDWFVKTCFSTFMLSLFFPLLFNSILLRNNCLTSTLFTPAGSDAHGTRTHVGPPDGQVWISELLPLFSGSLDDVDNSIEHLWWTILSSCYSWLISASSILQIQQLHIF